MKENQYLIVEPGFGSARVRVLRGGQYTGPTLGTSNCTYSMAELNTHSDRIPQKLMSAKLQCEIENKPCDVRCREITLTVTVLRKQKKCTNSIATHVWKIEQEQIVVGYYLGN